jgi:hypothetical protein
MSGTDRAVTIPCERQRSGFTASAEMLSCAVTRASRPHWLEADQRPTSIAPDHRVETVRRGRSCQGGPRRLP